MKMWVELVIWYWCFIVRDFFKFIVIFFFLIDLECECMWWIDMVLWSEWNMEVFVGFYNKGCCIFFVMDEVFVIFDFIWEVVEGVFIDEDIEIIWVVFGNFIWNKGWFCDCYFGGKFVYCWQFFKVDFWIVFFMNKIQIVLWMEDYGEDFDFICVCVFGEFLCIDVELFIFYDFVNGVVNCEVEFDGYVVFIFGVDVGCFGDDFLVIYLC